MPRKYLQYSFSDRHKRLLPRDSGAAREQDSSSSSSSLSDSDFSGERDSGGASTDGELSENSVELVEEEDVADTQPVEEEVGGEAGTRTEEEEAATGGTGKAERGRDDPGARGDEGGAVATVAAQQEGEDRGAPEVQGEGEAEGEGLQAERLWTKIQSLLEDLSLDMALLVLRKYLAGFKRLERDVRDLQAHFALTLLLLLPLDQGRKLADELYVTLLSGVRKGGSTKGKRRRDGEDHGDPGEGPAPKKTA